MKRRRKYLSAEENCHLLVISYKSKKDIGEEGFKRDNAAGIAVGHEVRRLPIWHTSCMAAGRDVAG